MSWLRKNLRFLAAVQLLPALESGEETLVGGQAVLEGVMMRSPHACAIAVRRPDGAIATYREAVVRPSERRKWLGWPVIRGVATLGQAMMLGFRALKFSANVALEEIERGPDQKKLEVPGWVAALNALLSVGFFIVFYKLVPVYATRGLAHYWPSFNGHVMFNLVDGVIRIALFLLFLWAVSLWADMRRVFQYHGAEHKTVFAFEDGGPLEIAAAQKYSTFHPRCGTSFLMTVMLISVAFYMLFPVTTPTRSSASPPSAAARSSPC
jgi:uncharacterized protein YqhQ